MKRSSPPPILVLVLLLAAVGTTLYLFVQRSQEHAGPQTGGGRRAASPSGPLAPLPEEVPPRPRAEAEVPLDAGDSGLQLRVVDEGGRSVVGASLVLRSGAQAERRTTDGAGRATYANLAPGVYAVRVEAPDGTAFVRARDLELSGASQSVELVLPPLRGSIAGRVTDSSGSPLSGVEVSLRALARASAPGSLVLAGALVRRTETDRHGSYELRDLPPGLFALDARADGFAPKPFEARAGERGADAVLLRLHPVRVAGTVLSAATGAPLPQARVALRGAGSRSTLTAEDGTFAIEVATHEGAALRLTASFTQHAPFSSDLATLALLERDLQALELRLEPEPGNLRVRGRVRTARGEPARDAALLLRRGAEVWMATADAAGHFEFEGVPTGEGFSFTARHAASGGRAFLGDLEFSGFDEELEVELSGEEPGSVRGRVVDPFGQPVTSLFYEARSPDLDAPLAVRTDDSGSFVLDGVPPGPVSFESQGAAFHSTHGLELQPGEDVELGIVADVGGFEIHGRAVGATGNWLQGARVQCVATRREGGLTHVTRRQGLSAPDGSFQFTELGPGPHLVTVSSDGHQPRSIEVSTEESPGFLELSLTPRD